MIEGPPPFSVESENNFRGETTKQRNPRRRAQAADDCRLIAGLTFVDYLAWRFIFDPSLLLFAAGCIVHLGIIGILAWRLQSRVGTKIDVKYIALALILGVLVGAVGMTIGVLIAAGGLLLKKSRQLIDAWYQRQADSVTHDEIAKLYDSIYSGRETPQSMRNVDNYVFAMTEGTFSQKQSILEVVARSYRPELLPVLNLALRSPVAAIRVQASAVKGKLFTSVMTSLRAALDDLGSAESNQEVAAAGRRLSQCIFSGLLEPDQKYYALVASKKVHDVAGSLKYTDHTARELFHDLRHLIAYFDDAAAWLVEMEAYGGRDDQLRMQLQEALKSYEDGVSGLFQTSDEPVVSQLN